MNCFVNKNISGVDNQNSKLNADLNRIFPMEEGRGNLNSMYLKLRQDGGGFKSKFPVDWETKEGQEYINTNHPGFLGEQGEPKLYIDKVGRAYFKTPEGNYFVNKATISENERLENVKAMMASYTENSTTDLRSFVKESIDKNAIELDSIIYKQENEADKQLEIHEAKGASSSVKATALARYEAIQKDISKLSKSMTFLMSAKSDPAIQEMMFHDIKNSLAQAKIAYEDDVDEREKHMNESSMDLSFLKPSNEINPLNSVDPEILKLLSTIPKTNLKFDTNGNIASHEKAVSSLMPLLTYIHDYSTVFNEIQSVLNDVVAIDLKIDIKDVKSSKKKIKEILAAKIRRSSLFDSMYDKLSEYAKDSNSSISHEVLNKLDELLASKSPKDKIAIKSAFAKSFNKSKTSNIMHTTESSKLRLEGRAGEDMISVHSIDLSSDEYRTSALASEMVVNSFMKLNSSLTNAEKNELEKAELGLRNPKSFYTEKENLRSYLKIMYGMSLEDKTLSDIIKYTNNLDSKGKSKTKLLSFLDNMFSMSSLSYKTSEVIVSGKEKATKKSNTYDLDNLAKDYFKQSSEEKELILENFTDNGGNTNEFKKIAEFEYKNSPTSADSSISSGSKKIWLYSFISKIKKDILTWQAGDLSSLEKLKNTGNGMVDYLLGKQPNGSYDTRESQLRIDKLSLNNNLELRQKMDSSPEPFSSLSEEDLILLTYNTLNESEKEKYVQMRGVNRTGNSADLAQMSADDRRGWVNSFMFLNNADRTQVLSLSGILTGNSNVEVNEKGGVESIGPNNIAKVKALFEGEIKKITDGRKTIVSYTSMPDSTPEERAKKLSFSLRNLVPGWHYAKSFKDEEGVTHSVDNLDPDSIIPDILFVQGNYRKFGFLNGFYNAYKDKIDGRYFEQNEGKDPLASRDRLDTIKFNIDEAIDDYYSNILTEEVKDITDMTGSSEKKFGAPDEDLSRKGLFELQTSVIHKGTDLKINQYNEAGNFLMNYYFHSVDLFHIFNGEVGLYKQKGSEFNMADPLKRTPAVNADGIYATNHDPLEISKYIPYGGGPAIEYFKNTKTIFAVIKDQEYKGSFYGDSINRLISDNDKQNKIDLKGDVSDGASYGHPEFLFDFYQRTYGVNEKNEKLHKELMDPETVPNEEHFKFLNSMGGSNQPGKLQAFSIMEGANNARIPLFWKSSVLPLYPSLTKGFGIDKLRLQIMKQNIGVVGNESAFKGVVFASTNLFEDNGAFHELGEMEKKIDLNPFEVNTGDLKIQVELHAKGDKEETVAGSQPLRNVTANMDLESAAKPYKFRKEAKTGKEMKQIYDSSIKNIVSNQLSEFLNKIEYKGPGLYNEEIFRKMLTKQFTDLDFDLKDILEDVNMPLETIPGISNRIFPILTSHIEKNVAKPRTNGTAAIQSPNAGFSIGTKIVVDDEGVSHRVEKTYADLTDDEKKGTILFNEGRNPRPPRPTTYEDFVERLRNSEDGEQKILELDNRIEEYNKGKSVLKQFDKYDSPLYFSEDESDISFEKKLGYHANIESGEILIPFSSLFKNSKMSWEEFNGHLRDENGNPKNIDMDILENIIGYRIPNQSVSSNDSFKVVGILHPSVGDTAIMYHEITAKTGSDFDIDKMVLMLPNFNTIYKKNTKEPSKQKQNVINETIRDTPIYGLMQTNSFESMDQVYGVLMRNQKLRDAAMKQDFFEKDAQGKVDFFIENRHDIEFILEKDHRKASNKKDFEYSIKDTLADLYDAIEMQNDEIDRVLIEKNLGARDRHVVDRFEYISDNSEKGMQNQLIEAIKSILTSSQTYDDLISPLDGTHIKDSILDVRYEYYLANQGGVEAIEDYRNRKASSSEEEKEEADADFKEFLKNSEKSLVASMMPKFLAKSKTDMQMAKNLTATMANHMTNIPLTQANKVFLKYNIGIGTSRMDRTHIIGKENDDKFKITKMVSYLMNASVDAAKDPYIIDGNYNRYTSGAAMLFVRLGIDPVDGARILQHPEIVALTKTKLGSKSKIAYITSQYTNEELDTLAYNLAQQINDKTEAYITPEKFLLNVAEAKSNVPVSKRKGLTNEEILGFWHMAVTIGKDLNEAIQLSKPESTPTTASEFHSISNAHDKADGNSFASVTDEKEQIGGGMVFKERTTGIHPLDQKGTTEFDENGNYVSGLKGSYVEAISNAGISLINEISASRIIERTPGYSELVNRVMINLGMGYSINEDKIKKISSMIYPYVLASTNHEMYEFIQSKEYGIDDIKDMLETLPRDIIKLKGKDEYQDNVFLKELSVDESKGFISFNNVSNYSDQSKIAIKDDANVLYNSDDEFIDDTEDEDRNLKEAMKRLIKYSFFTTGFRPSSYSFANYLPKQYFVDSEHNESVRVLLEKLKDKDSYADAHTNRVMMFLASNRPQDENIVKKLTYGNVVHQGVPITHEAMIKKLSYTDPDTKEKHFYPFVSYQNKGRVYNLALTKIEKAVKGGDPDAPVYERINVMQFQSDNKFNENEAVEKDSEEGSDENGPIEYKGVSGMDIKGRNSRLLLFDVNMANTKAFFTTKKDANVLTRDTKGNLNAFRGRVLFDLKASDESRAAEKERKLYLQGIGETKDKLKTYNEGYKDIDSNEDVYDSLSKMVSLNSDEIEEYKRIIDYFYSQDGNSSAKQKAINELDKLKGCN